MYITKNLVKSFVKDIISLSNNIQEVKGRVSIEPISDGIRVTLQSEKGYLKKEAIGLAISIVSKWGSINSGLIKYKGYIEENVSKRFIHVEGEGKYPHDYIASVDLYFEFGNNLVKFDGTKYHSYREKLQSYLRKLTKDGYIFIKDEGSVCNIGGYFEFNYTSGKIKSIGVVNLHPNEERELSRLVSDLLLSLGDMPVPVCSVFLERAFYFNKDLYFFSVGEECILWNDIDKHSKLKGMFTPRNAFASN